MAGIDILASAFSGANAAFLADLYARWVNDPASVDQSFADLFDAMNDEARAVLEDASGASWAPRPSFNEPETVAAKPAQGGLALDQVRAAIITSLRALMLIRSYRVRGHLEAKLDPLGLTKSRLARRTRSENLRLHRSRHGQADFHRQRARPRNRDLAGDHADPPPDLLRPHRRRVHAHPGPRAEILDPAQGRGRPLADLPRRRRKAHHPAASDRSRGLRGVLPEALRHHQTLRPGGWRSHHPRAARDHRDRRCRRCGRGRDRHAASRPPEHPGQHRQEAAHRAVQRIRRRKLQAG